MATSCVDFSNCGTYYAGWMSGSLPTVAEGNVTRKVCYTGRSDCCEESNNIEVVNCGRYYVYNLSPLPWCDFKYCGSY